MSGFNSIVIYKVATNIYGKKKIEFSFFTSMNHTQQKKTTNQNVFNHS